MHMNGAAPVLESARSCTQQVCEVGGCDRWSWWSEGARATAVRRGAPTRTMLSGGSCLSWDP